MGDLPEPHDLAVERHIIGSCLLAGQAIRDAIPIVEPGDFHHPSHRLLFQAIVDMHSHGQAVDALTLADCLTSRRQRSGTQLDAVGGGEELVGLSASAPAISNVARYAGIVADHSRRRRIMRAAIAAAEAAAYHGEPCEVIDNLTHTVETIDLGTGGALPDRYSTVGQFLDRPEGSKAPWVIPALLRRDWRVVVVADEGSGKSNLLRCLAGYTAQGLHPFVDEMCEPTRVLVVDLENSDEPIESTFSAIRRTALLYGGYDDDRWHIWPQPGGIDIRRRVDFADLERAIGDARPDILVIGPAYKLFNQTAREDNELVAKEVLARLDDLRTRHSFALVVEHHAPFGEGGRKREIRPFGSSAWLRWPEIGIGLDKWAGIDAGWQMGHLLKVDRWRPDRVRSTWPDWVSRGRRRLWAGHYETIAPRPPLYP